jgi:very-short-patch-repair endonuclease
LRLAVSFCNMSADDLLTRFATEHHGIFTKQHVDDAGLSQHAREHRIRSGRWEPIHPGVYRVAGAPVTWHGDLLAACWAAPGPGVASHRSAAALWGLPGGTDEMVEVTCDRWRRAQLPGLIVHETGTLPPDDVTERHTIPCMTIERTLLSLGAVLHPSTVEMAVDNALRRGLTTVSDLRSIVRRLGRRGRNGVGVLRRVVELHDTEAGLTESAMETRLKWLLREHGLPSPVFQHEIRHHGRFVARVDAAYPEFHLAIEYDSYAHHTGRVALVRDSRRRNALVGAGWSVISVTAADIQAGGNAVVTTLRSLLDPDRLGVTRA